MVHPVMPTASIAAVTRPASGLSARISMRLRMTVSIMGVLPSGQRLCERREDADADQYVEREGHG